MLKPVWKISAVSPSFESHNAENKNSSELRAIVRLPRNLLPLRSSRISMSEEGEFLKTVGFICFDFLLPYYYAVTIELRTNVWYRAVQIKMTQL